jgi:lysophospholipase L1-like esterase
MTSIFDVSRSFVRRSASPRLAGRPRFALGLRSRGLWVALSLTSTSLVGCSAGSPSPIEVGSPQGLTTSSSSMSGFFLRDGDTVVFFGDSISSLYDRTWPTWNPPVYPPGDENYNYCMDIVSWATTQLPGSNIKFYDMAVPGETTAGDEWPTNGPHPASFAPGYGGDIASHLAYIESLNPTVVTVDLGMNDAEYSPDDPTLDEDFVNGIDFIVSSLLDWSEGHGGSLRIVLLSPSYFDYPRFVATGWNPGWAIPSDYNAADVAGYGAWEQYYVRTLGNPNVTFIDLNTPMANATALLAAGESLTQEGIHPTWQGYQLIAATILQAWGAPASTLEYPNIQSIWGAFAAGQANIWGGSQEYVWTGPPITTGGSSTGPGCGPSVPAPVELTVADSAGLFWDSGNYQRGGSILQVYPSYIPNPAQDWAWTASGAGFTVCNTGGSPCLSDNGSEVVMGTESDIFTINGSGAIQDLTTGQYLQAPGSSEYGAYVTTGSTESVWTFSASLH